MSDVRFSTLIVALYILVRWLSRTPQKTPILEQLIRIKQDLTLDRIDLESAKRQIDLALYGLRSSDILQKYVDGYLLIMERFSKEMHQARQKSNIRNNLHGKRKKELSKDDQIIDESLKNDIASHLKIIENLFNIDLEKILFPLSLHVIILERASLASSSYDKNRRELINILTDVQMAVKAGFAELRAMKESKGIYSEEKEPKVLESMDLILSRIMRSEKDNVRKQGG